MGWDPKTYLAFGAERTRPAADLLARVPVAEPRRVADLGCGPGNSTALLRARWPEAEIDGNRARQIATAMAEYMRRRSDQVLPRPKLLSDDPENDDVGLPLSLREFIAIDPEVFTEDLFRDFVDERGAVVHSLASFLTVWTSIATGTCAACWITSTSRRTKHPS